MNKVKIFFTWILGIGFILLIPAYCIGLKFQSTVKGGTAGGYEDNGHYYLKVIDLYMDEVGEPYIETSPKIWYLALIVEWTVFILFIIGMIAIPFFLIFYLWPWQKRWNKDMKELFSAGKYE
ncbi:MAG: hypothetical protein Ta2A_06330 [Treponemataceae bacterium]|nr:MAG: hypothetical protein Ta2A_06330 [Treponemataceae bacterium]